MRSDRGAPYLARASWLGLLSLAASCTVEPYPTNHASQRRVGEEVFWVMCKRVAKDAYPEDDNGRRFNDVCSGSGDSTGALGSPQASRLKALVLRRTQIVAALDQVFGDLPSAGTESFADDEITHFLAEIVPFYDPPDQLLPAASDAIAAVLAKLIDPLNAEGAAVDPNSPEGKRAQAVLQKFEAVAKRKGYRPSNRTLGFLHAILTYRGLDEVGKSLLGFVGEGGGGHDAMVALLKAAALELAEDAEPADPADPDRVDTTLHAALDLLLVEDDALAEAPRPSWVVRRDASGNALLKSGVSGNVPTPFPVPRSQDSAGRPAGEPAGEYYEFVDASKTALAGAMREAKAIVERTNPDTPSTLDNLMRGLRPIMGPTTAQTYDFAGKPYSFQGPDLTQGAMLDLVHAAGVLATYPEVADALELVRVLLEEHESAAAGPVDVSIKINDRADQHEEAVLTGYDGTPETPNEFWDDVIGVAQRMLQRPGQLEALVKSFADPVAGPQGKLYGTWMRHKDDAPYVGEPITPDGPGPANLGGAYSDEQRQQMNTTIAFEYMVEVDRSQPDVGMNRSIWQRTMSLINALNGKQICNPEGSNLTVGTNLIGNLTFPLAAEHYAECDAININDAVEIYGQAVLGRAQLVVQDPAALGLGSLTSPLGIVMGVDAGEPFGRIFEVYTDIDGLTDAPNAPAMARFIYAPRNKFLATLMGEQQLSRDGVPMVTYEPHAMFHLENGQAIADGHSFLTAGVPLVKAFDDTELREPSVDNHGKLLDGYMFGTLLSTFHQHWPSKKTTACELPIAPGNEGCTQSLDPKAPLYARQSNIVSYEPLLIEALIDENLTGVLQRAAAEVQTVQVNGKDGLKVIADLAARLLTPDPALTYRDGRKFSYTNTCNVPAGTIDPPASCGCPAGTTEAEGDLCALAGGGFMPRGRIIQGGVPPIYLVLDALKKIDNAFLGDNAARLDPWHQARSNLVDQLLTADYDASSESYRMHNQRARFLGARIIRWALDRIAAHREVGDLATWGPELATRFHDTFRHPLVAGGLDLLDKFWEDKAAATQWAAISAHIMNEAQNPEAFENFLVALADTLTLVDREPDITPLVQFASLGVAPNAFDALDKGAAPDVEHGAAYLGLEVARNVMGVDESPEPSAITKLLKNLVIPSSTGEAPAEVLFDMIAEINRRDPNVSADVPLPAGDQRAVFDQSRQFMVDEDHGLKRLYSVIQNRKVH